MTLPSGGRSRKLALLRGTYFYGLGLSILIRAGGGLALSGGLGASPAVAAAIGSTTVTAVSSQSMD